MKKIIIILGFIAPFSLMAQLDRSVRPQPGKAPEINIKDSETFTLDNGVQVIVSENHKLPRVSIDLYTSSDPKIEGGKAGLADFAGQMIMSGTSKRDKDQLDKEIDYIGASVNASSSSLSLSCLTKHMEKGLDLMTDVLYNANFPSAEFDRIKKQLESGLISAKADPSAMASNVESKVNFLNHPYGEVMTEATLANISLADINAYYKETFIPKGSYLVMVGDITPAKAKEIALKYFASWKGGEMFKNNYNGGNLSKGNQVFFVKKPGAVQSVVNVSFPMDIRMGSNDQLALEVLNGIFGGGGFGTRLMQNLREDKAYTYGSYSTANIRNQGSWLSLGGNFRNEVTDSAITQLLFELDRITNGYVSDDELNLTKESMAGRFARSMESPSTVARFALNIFRYNLPKDYYQTYLKRLEAITKEDILTMAQKYFTAKNCNIVVVGSEDILNNLKQFDADGKVQIMDAYGDEAKEMLPADITKEQLIEKYILKVTASTSMKKAAKKLKKVKSMMQVIDATTAQAPFPLKMTKIWMAPAIEGDKLEAQGMVFQKSFFDGKSGSTTSMQTGKKELTAEEIASKQKSVGLFPEMNYKTSGMTYDLLGIEEMNGKKFYVLKLNDGKNDSFEYYSTESFLKEKSTSIVKQDDGETIEVTANYADYKDVNGLLFPFIVNMSFGEMGLKGTVKSVELNTKIDTNLFK